MGELTAARKSMEEHLIAQLISFFQCFKKSNQFLRMNAIAILIRSLAFGFKRRPDHNHVSPFRPIFHTRGPISFSPRAMNPDDELIGFCGINRVREIDMTVHVLFVFDD